MEKRSCRAALLLAFLVCFTMLFSSFFIAAEADHACTGDRCPVCRQISICENTLKALGSAAGSAAVFAAACFAEIAIRRPREKKSGHTSLITLKVKLSN